LDFLSDIETTCEECKGRRYKSEVMQFKVKGKSIYDVLSMTISEAYSFFKGYNAITGPLQVMKKIGIGYLRLGQPVSTLSGGEAQRLRLVTELLNCKGEHNLYLLDEPTKGLHFRDINGLVLYFNKLVDKGHTLCIIEHNLEIIKCADYVIDIGPDGGDKGGNVVVSGIPEEVAENRNSFTGKALKDKLSLVP
jgi:excinuclease ABC subunit A